MEKFNGTGKYMEEKDQVKGEDLLYMEVYPVPT